jgi:hypothetical protein
MGLKSADISRRYLSADFELSNAPANMDLARDLSFAMFVSSELHKAAQFANGTWRPISRVDQPLCSAE